MPIISKMVGAGVLWSWLLGYNRAPIGNGTWGIKWSRDAKR